MKNVNFYLIILFVLFSSCRDHKLSINGKEGYQIVIPAQADSIEQRAARELQSYLMKMSKTELSIVQENEYRNDIAIYIGRTDYAKVLDVDFDQLEEDGYAFKPHNRNFVIAGGSEKGVLYGVYDLLEALGVRKYTADYTYIPMENSIALPMKDTVVVPKIKHREVQYNYAYKPDFFNWHKLDSHRETWGAWVHTFARLVPSEKYGETHPEYYAFWDHKRHTGDGSQLCLSNPEVLDTLINNLRTEIANKPDLKYWSVSQNDNENYCHCNLCNKLNETYGGDVTNNSGSIIYFVNKVARAFPDKIISTLAYQYSRKAPENIKPEPNVNIMLCSIESARHLPVPQTDPDFASDLAEWGKLTNNIIVWDYTVQFHNLVSPFPNLHTLKPNMDFFTENNVKKMFEQGDYYTGKGGEMSELRTYLLAKLLWNPDADDQAIIDDFVIGYYGDAGTFIRQYIDTMQHALIESGHQLEIFSGPDDAMNTYLTAEMMQEYKRLFDKAENAVKEDQELLKRVQIARLPIMYAELEIACTEMDNPRSMYERTASGEVAVRPEIKRLTHLFVERCNDQGVNQLRERATTPDDYMGSFSRIFDIMNNLKNALSFQKRVIPVTSPSTEHGAIEALTDGVIGSYESFYKPVNWVGYEGEHMEFILDLGEIMTVNSVNIDFLNGRTPFIQIFLPEYVIYKTSVDAESYSDGVKVSHPYTPGKSHKESNKEGIFVRSFQTDLDNRQARYIKVHAENILNCPSWHMSTGKPAWLFADEIVVK